MSGLTDASKVTFFDPYPEAGLVHSPVSAPADPGETFFELDAVPESTLEPQRAAEPREVLFDLGQEPPTRAAADDLELQAWESEARESEAQAEADEQDWFDRISDEQAHADASMSELDADVASVDFFDTGEQPVEDELWASEVAPEATTEGDQQPESATEPQSPSPSDLDRAARSYDKAIAMNNLFNTWKFDTYDR